MVVMRLCGRSDSGGECVGLAVHRMMDGMKKEVAERQNIAYSDQIVVAKIYDITAAILSEACRRNLGVDKQDCEPSEHFNSEHLTLDTFILLNQMKEDGIISEEYKQILFDALIKIKPELKKKVEEDRSLGLI